MKLAILVEMLVLWGGPVLVRSQQTHPVQLGGADRPGGVSQVPTGLAGVLLDPWFLHHTIAVIIVMAILLTLADLNAGTPAMLFGLLIVAGYLNAAAGTVGPTLETVTQNL